MSNAFDMSKVMAIDLLGGLRWLNPETTLAEMEAGPRQWSALVKSRAGSNYPVPPRWTGGGAASISSLPCRAAR